MADLLTPTIPTECLSCGRRGRVLVQHFRFVPDGSGDTVEEWICTECRPHAIYSAPLLGEEPGELEFEHPSGVPCRLCGTPTNLIAFTSRAPVCRQHWADADEGRTTPDA